MFYKWCDDDSFEVRWKTSVSVKYIYHYHRAISSGTTTDFGAFPVNNNNDFRPNHRIGCAILNDLGHRITSVSADDKEAQFLFQRLYRSAEI